MAEGEADRRAVEAVNTAFYEAVETADLDTMLDLWADSEETTCVHPGAAPVRGTGPIGRSWALIMANTPYIQFFLTDVEVLLHGGADGGRPEVATVTCTENVLTGDASAGTDVFGGGKAVATNVFLRTPDGWRLWIHHASPVLSAQDDDHD